MLLRPGEAVYSKNMLVGGSWIINTSAFSQFSNSLHHNLDFLLVAIMFLSLFYSGLLQPSELPCQWLSAQSDGHKAGQHVAFQLRPGLPAHRPEQRHMYQDSTGDPPVECSSATLPG